MKYVIEMPDYNLADWVVNNFELKDLKEIDLTEKVFGDMPVYTTIQVNVYGKPLLAAYVNNGQCFFNEGDELGNYLLDNSDFWFIGSIFDTDGNEIDVSKNSDFDFDFSEDGTEWTGTVDGEQINNYFRLNSSGQAPFADFVGFFKVK